MVPARSTACPIALLSESDKSLLTISEPRRYPLRRTYHGEVHRFGNEASWWTKYNLDPLPFAEALWTQTHPDFAATPNYLPPSSGDCPPHQTRTLDGYDPERPRDRKTKLLNASAR